REETPSVWPRAGGASPALPRSHTFTPKSPLTARRSASAPKLTPQGLLGRARRSTSRPDSASHTSTSPPLRPSSFVATLAEPIRLPSALQDTQAPTPMVTLRASRILPV